MFHVFLALCVLAVHIVLARSNNATASVYVLGNDLFINAPQQAKGEPEDKRGNVFVNGVNVLQEIRELQSQSNSRSNVFTPPLYNAVPHGHGDGPQVFQAYWGDIRGCDLTPFVNTTHVFGNVYLDVCYDLQGPLMSLSNLVFVSGALEIHMDIDMFTSLEYIGGDFVVTLRAFDFEKLSVVAGKLTVDGIGNNNPFPILKRIGGGLEIDIQNHNISFPSLQTIAQHISLIRNDDLRLFDLPELQYVGTDVTVEYNYKLERLSMPQLKTARNIRVVTNLLLQQLMLNMLNHVAQLLVTNNKVLPVLLLPNLQRVDGLLKISNNALSTFRLDKLEKAQELFICYNNGNGVVITPQMRTIAPVYQLCSRNCCIPPPCQC